MAAAVMLKLCVYNRKFELAAFEVTNGKMYQVGNIFCVDFMCLGVSFVECIEVIKYLVTSELYK